MRKKIFAILFILLIGLASAEYFRPETVKAMDVTITTKAAGSFSGTITRGDSMEVYYLSINDDKDQEVKELEEYLEIGDKKIAQSNAIARYLAKKYNLAGKDDWESAKIDEIVDAMADLRNGEFHFLFPPFVWMGENLGK